MYKGVHTELLPAGPYQEGARGAGGDLQMGLWLEVHDQGARDEARDQKMWPKPCAGHSLREARAQVQETGNRAIGDREQGAGLLSHIVFPS